MGAQGDLCQNVSWSIGCLTLVESFGSYQTISLIYLLLYDPFKFEAVTTWYYTIFNSHLYIEIYREIYIFRCKEKLTLNDGTLIADPYGLSNNWKNDVLLLPDISWTDIHNYIKSPSAYLMKTWKLINHLKFLIFCMQSCSRYVLSFCFKRINVLLCQNKGKSEIVWFGKCLSMNEFNFWLSFRI